MSDVTPKGWRQARLGEIADLFNGKAGGTGGTWLRVFKTRHVYDGFVRLKDPAFAPDEKASSVAKDTYLRPGDTLTPNMAHGTIGRVAFVREAAANWTVDGQIMVLRPKDDSVVGRYIYDWMSRPESKRLLVNMEKGGAFDELRGQTHIYRDDVASIPLLVPPLPEQKKIAAILSSVDDAIESTQAVIDQLQVVKKAMMAELLTRGLPGRHTRFKQTEIGEVPEGWAIVPLSELARVRGGKRMPKGRPFATGSTPYPYIRVSDFGDGSVRLHELKYVLPEDREAIRQYTISSRDLYISIAGTLGVVGEVPESLDGAQLTENAAKICEIQAERVDRGYLMFTLQGKGSTDQIGRLKGVGAGVPKLALFRIESILIALPPIDEQRLISDVLRGLDTRMCHEREDLVGIMALKSALMSALLTGEIRVTPDAAPT